MPLPVRATVPIGRGRISFSGGKKKHHEVNGSAHWVPAREVPGNREAPNRWHNRELGCQHKSKSDKVLDKPDPWRRRQGKSTSRPADREIGDSSMMRLSINSAVFVPKLGTIQSIRTVPGRKPAPNNRPK
jgi:hypothetical protein